MKTAMLLCYIYCHWIFRVVTSVDRPLCTCGAHVIWSRHRFAMLNDRPRLQAFKQALKQVINIFMANHMSLHVNEGKHTCTSAIFLCIKQTCCCVSSNIFYIFQPSQPIL